MNGRNRYILIVDDDLDARDLLHKIITPLKFEVRMAIDGHEALRMIREEPPALLLLDLMMPVMNGFEVLFNLQADPNLRRIPVIVVSAVTDENLLMLPGVSKVIRKASLRYTEIQSIVSSLMEKTLFPS